MQKAELNGPLMYLWRPSPVVTIGRHQNPWKECVLQKLEDDKVALVRRRSGGGAVFQDLGCSVFTFVAPSECFSIDRNMDIVLGALRRLNIPAERKGRNDIVYEDRKISGSAFKHDPGRNISLHHGTVLVETDMQALQRYLTPDKRKLQAKGIASVGARVRNLRDDFPNLDHDVLCNALIAEFAQVYSASQCPLESVTQATAFVSDPAFQGFYGELNDPEWRFGRTPDFSHQLETRIDGVGVFDVHMEVVGGKVTEAIIFSDALYPDLIDAAREVLVGVNYGRAGIQSALISLSQAFSQEGPQMCLRALTEWLVANVDD